MAEVPDEDDFPDVSYSTLVDYAEKVMDSHLTDVEWMTIHEMSDGDPSFPEGGISTHDAHVVDAIMSLTTVTYSWPTPEQVAEAVAERLRAKGEK